MCKHMKAGDNIAISFFHQIWVHVILIVLFQALNLSSHSPVVNPERHSLSNSFHLSICFVYLYLIRIILLFWTGLFSNKRSFSIHFYSCRRCATRTVRKHSLHCRRQTAPLSVFSQAYNIRGENSSFLLFYLLLTCVCYILDGKCFRHICCVCLHHLQGARHPHGLTLQRLL